MNEILSRRLPRLDQDYYELAGDITAMIHFTMGERVEVSGTRTSFIFLVGKDGKVIINFNITFRANRNYDLITGVVISPTITDDDICDIVNHIVTEVLKNVR